MKKIRRREPTTLPRTWLSSTIVFPPAQLRNMSLHMQRKSYLWITSTVVRGRYHDDQVYSFIMRCKSNQAREIKAVITKGIHSQESYSGVKCITQNHNRCASSISCACTCTHTSTVPDYQVEMHVLFCVHCKCSLLEPEFKCQIIVYVMIQTRIHFVSEIYALNALWALAMLSTRCAHRKNALNTLCMISTG